MTEESTDKIRIEDLSCFYGDFQALDKVTLAIRPNEVFGLMGPSKSGKSTLLRVLNRMCDLIVGVRVTGGAWLDGEDILAPDYDVVGLRRRVGLVLSRPTPLPRSIYENLALAPRLAGKRGRGTLDEVVETSLKAAQLWGEVKDRLGGFGLKTLRGPAAAPVSGPHPGHGARSDSAGRAHQRPGPHFHRQNRGDLARAEK